MHKAKKTVSVRLSHDQIGAVMESLVAHMSGDTSEGDLCWSERRRDAAKVAVLILCEAYVSDLDGSKDDMPDITELSDDYSS